MANESQTETPSTNAESYRALSITSHRESEPESSPDSVAAIAWLSPLLKDQVGSNAFLYQSWQTQSLRRQVVRGKGFAKPESMRLFPKRGEIRDMDGILWDVREVRATKHGFNLFFGTPTYHPGGYLHGQNRLIATVDLLDYWETNCTKLHGVLFDLPAGRTTLKRLRARLGFNFHDDMKTFWEDRIGDLESLTARQFAVKHGVDHHVAGDQRRRMFGNRIRPAGWWRKPRFIKVLLSGLTLVKMGRKLGVGITQAARLRNKARREFQVI